jgi:acetoin:2,6-dichlorophenolindophenol oxidoreductase subunit alpha
MIEATPHSVAAEPAAAQLRSMLERMVIIRRTEERLGADSRSGRLPGNVHLCIGQEAVAVGVCTHLSDDDYITSNHRGHGHFLAKGGLPRELVAEVYGRRTGACRGLGGSMHVADLSKGMLGANGIVGGGIGIAAGAALAAQAAGRGQVAVAFFGDGAASQGVLSEVLNIAALWHLPLVLVCEHNLYSEFSPSATVTAGSIGDRARPFGVPTVTIDGNDVLAVWRAAGAAVARARQGQGPSFIEAQTYRLRGHLEAEAGFIQTKYRSDEEVASWAARDPIPAFAAAMRARGLLEPDALATIESAVATLVGEAVRFAEASDLPNSSMVEEAGLQRAGA